MNVLQLQIKFARKLISVLCCGLTAAQHLKWDEPSPSKVRCGLLISVPAKDFSCGPI